MVLQHRIYGRIMAIIRNALEVSQQQLGEAMNIQASSVSKLENGTVLLAIFHVESFASAVNDLSVKLNGIDPAWTGWEIHRIAHIIADRIGDAGYTVMWAVPADSDGEEMVPDRKVGALVRQYWPQDQLARIGW